MMDGLNTQFQSEFDFTDLLWDDILFGQILPYLSIRDLFALRGVSRKCKILIDTYFQKMNSIRLGVSSENFNPEAFKVLTDNCHNLKEVLLADSPWLTDELIVPLFKNNLSLKKIVLNYCNNLTATCLQPVIIGCENLESLCLANCTWLTKGCFQSIILHRNTLVHMDFSGCSAVDDLELINSFICVFPRLKSLNISKMRCVDDSTLGVCARFAKQLEHLNISNCTRITGYGVSMVLENCLKLKSLTYVGCYQVNLHTLRCRPRPDTLLVPIPGRCHHLWLPNINV